MRVLRILLIGLFYLLFGIVLRIIFVPVNVMSFIGRKIQLQSRISGVLRLSTIDSERIRDDMIDQMQDPADSILAEEDYGHLPVTRHHLRRKGLQAIDEMENRMIEGETIISGLIAIIGVLLSLFALYPNTVRTLSSGYVRPAEEPVTMVSVLATLAGLFVVILIVTRYTIISNMMFSDKELSQGKPRILFIKQAWNSFVAKQPIMALTGFYLLHFADIAGEEVYNELLDMMGDAMQPNLNKVEFMRTNSHRIIGAMSREFRSE